MKCPNCNKEVKKGQKFCEECGHQLTKKVDDSRANLFCVLSIVFTYFMPILLNYLRLLFPGSRNILEPLFSISFLAGIVLMIYARVSFPNSKFAKILMIVDLVIFGISIMIAIFYIILVGVMIFSCIQSCRSGQCD